MIGHANNLSPIYSSGSKHYGIDTCLPQTRAIREGKITLHAVTRGHYPGTKIPQALLPGLSSFGFWDAVGPQDWGLESHRNEGVEIVLLETGRMLFTVDGTRHQLTAGSLTITRPWQLHCLGDPNIGASRLHWLILDVGVRRPHQEWKWPGWVVLTPGDLKELTSKLRRNEHPVWKTTPEIIRAFQALAICAKDHRAARKASWIIVHTNQLLLALLDTLRKQNFQEDAALTSRFRAVDLFLKDLAGNPRSLGEEWTLQTMAARCGMGGTVFAKYCRAITNTSPMDYLNRCRLDWAARRLGEEAGTPVIRIAFESGFSSSQYFATQFRRRYRMSPSDYRQKQLETFKVAARVFHYRTNSAPAKRT